MFKEFNQEEVNVYHAPYLLQQKLWLLLWRTHTHKHAMITQTTLPLLLFMKVNKPSSKLGLLVEMVVIVVVAFVVAVTLP
jgi:hypothetical protein